jgi:hypothetical protein
MLHTTFRKTDVRETKQGLSFEIQNCAAVKEMLCRDLRFSYCCFSLFWRFEGPFGHLEDGLRSSQKLA